MNKLASRWALSIIFGAALITLGWRVQADNLGLFNTFVPKDGGSKRIARDIAYEAGPRQQLDIYVPRTGAANVPVIVFFYGGSWNSGYRGGYEFAGRALAAQGFVVVVPDYRLVPAVHYPAFLQDCAAAVHWTREHIGTYGGDGRRIVLVGHSAGGYNAAMLALDPRWLGTDRQAVRGWVGMAGPYDFLPFDVPSAVDAFGQWPQPEDTQPVNHVGPGAPPALLLYGDKDNIVRPRNIISLAARLHDAQDSVTQKIYPDIGHIGLLTALSRPFRTKAPVLVDIATFAHHVTDATPSSLTIAR